MKASLKYLSLIFMAILCSLALASCGGKDPIDPDPEPEPVEKYAFVIGDKELEIKSVGCYHNSERKGYDFVVSSEDMDLSKEILSTPKGYCLVIDIPDEYCGKEFDIKKVSDVVDEDGDGWYFYLSYVENGKPCEGGSVLQENIQSGKIMMNFGLHKNVECKLEAVLTNGKKLECAFKGKYQKSEEYIFGWE